MKCEWYVYSFAEDADEPAAKKVAKEKEDNEVMYVRQLTELPKATDLIGFDNTGNVCKYNVPVPLTEQGHSTLCD